MKLLFLLIFFVILKKRVKIKKILKSKNLFFLTASFSFVFLLFISLIYFRQATTFSFVDEYTNIVAGYFLNNGKYLYTDIVFHHQLLMPYISSLFQQITHPDSLYKVILYHRIFVILFAIVMDLLLIYRFRYIGIGFILFFEPLKYYLFGNLFLAESLIVYPLIYLLGLVWENTKMKTITPFELLLSTFFTWFVIFMREPFIPLALVMYFFLLWKTHTVRLKFFSLLLLTILSLTALLTVNLKDYFYQLVTLNTTIVVGLEANPPNFFISFFYPLFILFENHWNFYRGILVGLDIIFLFTLGFLFYKKKNLIRITMLLVLLYLANIRWVSSTTNFYLGYHATVWFGMFCFVTFLLIKETYLQNKKIAYSLLLGSVIIFMGMLFYPASYLWERIDREQTFTINYGKFSSNGKVISILSSPTDTLFAEYWDTLLYWQAGVNPSYKYSMYLPIAHSVPIFRNERTRMFKNNPPTFYYTDCVNNKVFDLLPKETEELYEPLYFSDKPTCLFITKKKVQTLSEDQLVELKKSGYYFSEPSL